MNRFLKKKFSDPPVDATPDYRLPAIAPPYYISLIAKGAAGVWSISLDECMLPAGVTTLYERNVIAGRPTPPILPASAPISVADVDAIIEQLTEYRQSLEHHEREALRLSIIEYKNNFDYTRILERYFERLSSTMVSPRGIDYFPIFINFGNAVPHIHKRHSTGGMPIPARHISAGLSAKSMPNIHYFPDIHESLGDIESSSALRCDRLSRRQQFNAYTLDELLSLLPTEEEIYAIMAADCSLAISFTPRK